MKGVRARLVLWNVAVIGVILAAMGLALRFRLRETLLAQVDRKLRQEAGEFQASHIDHAVAPRDASARPRGKAAIIRKRRIVTDPNETKLVRVFGTTADTITLHGLARLPRLVPVFDPGAPPSRVLDPVGFRQAVAGRGDTHDFVDEGHPCRSVSLLIRVAGRPFAVVQAVEDLGPVEAEMHWLDLALMTLLPVGLLVAAVAGAALVAGAMRPLRLLTDAARSLDPDKRLPVVGKDEFADLAGAFNEAFDRTAVAFATQERAMRQLERFTGDAGHELRTPLGAIKGSVTLLLDRPRLGGDVRKSLEIIDRACDRMTRLVRDLLMLARQDARAAPRAAVAIDLRSSVDQALEMLTAPAGISVHVCVDGAPHVFGDADSMERVFGNLLANAFAHARSTVKVSARPVGGMVDIHIEDDGPGIAPEHLPRLGERFYRPESSRSRDQGGTGLGLAIAKGIVESHGGALMIRSELGVGTTVVVTLPAA